MRSSFEKTSQEYNTQYSLTMCSSRPPGKCAFALVVIALREQYSDKCDSTKVKISDKIGILLPLHE